MNKISTKLLIMLLIVFAVIIYSKEVNAATFKCMSEYYRNTYIVPFGKEITIQKKYDEKVVSNNPEKARIYNNKIQVKGVGKFTVTVEKGDEKQDYNFFAWNVFLKDGTCTIFNDENLTNVADTLYSKAYLAVSENATGSGFKIDDEFTTTGRYTGNEIDGKYITSYYSKKDNISTSDSFEYSLKQLFIEGVDPVDAINITLDKESFSIYEQKKEKIKATIEPKEAKSNIITWTSSDRSVARVSKTGVVRAIKAGTAIITAEVNGHKASCTVTVIALSDAYANGDLVLKESTIALKRGKKPSYILTVLSPQNIPNTSIKWSSSDESVAIVKDTGKVIAKKPGTAIITAKLGKKEATCTVKVKRLLVLFVGNSKTFFSNYRKYTIEIGTKAQLRFKGRGLDDKTSEYYKINLNSPKIYKGGFYSLTIGGNSLKQIYKKKGYFLDGFKFDYVIMQQDTDEILNYDTYYEGAKYIIEKVYNNNPNVEVFIRNVWATRRNADGLSEEAAKLVSSKDTIKKAFATTKKVIEDLNANNVCKNEIKIINDGPAMYEAERRKYPVFSDVRHQSKLGAYLAALSANAAIFGIEPTKAYVPKEIEEKYDTKTIQTIQTIVANYNFNK